MLNKHVNGTLTCFCANEFESQGFSLFFKQYTKDGASSAICSRFLMLWKFSDSFYWVTSVSIIIYNYLFYIFTMPLLKLAGFHVKT